MLNRLNIFQNNLATLCFEGPVIKCLTARGEKILAWKTAELPRSQMNQGIIRDPQAVSEVVAGLLKELEATKKKVITCVTDHRSIHRVMTLPRMKKNLLQEAIRRKAKQEFPTPAEETDFSWHIVGETEDEIKVYVLAVPKVVIDQQMKTLRAADIKPREMDAKPLALLHTVSRKRCIILNLEPYSMAVMIVDNGLPALVRTIPLENEELTGEAKVDLLSQELARSAKFYNESHKDHPLPGETPVYLTGQLFAPPRLDERLHSEPTLISRLEGDTPYPVQVPAPPLDYPGELPVANYAVNLGLVMKGNR